MIRYTSVLLFISIVLTMIDLIQLSSEYEKHSTDSELYDEYSLDRTIDETDQEDRKPESASKLLEEEINSQTPSVDNDIASESYESSEEGNLYLISSIAILFLNPVHGFLIFQQICFVCFDSF